MWYQEVYCDTYSIKTVGSKTEPGRYAGDANKNGDISKSEYISQHTFLSQIINDKMQ